MAYCLRELPLEAQLLITGFRQHFLDIAQLRAAGGTPCARAISGVTWQNRRFHPNRYYNWHPVWDYHSSGVWRLRSDRPLHRMFIVHDPTAQPGDPRYGRAVRYAEFELCDPPTDDYEDDEHFSIDWLTDSSLDEESQRFKDDYYH